MIDEDTAGLVGLLFELACSFVSEDMRGQGSIGLLRHLVTSMTVETLKTSASRNCNKYIHLVVAMIELWISRLVEIVTNISIW